LHYIENNQQCKGRFDPLDVGAEYANYSSDMTRTFRFQVNFLIDKSSLQCCLNVKTKLQKCLSQERYGNNTISKWKLMTSELLGLGLIDKTDVQNENELACLQKCTVPHHMGLDTRLRILTEPMQTNMVFTVEPEFIFLPKVSNSS
jgi:Xaa-Pro aminopeptidase